MSSEIDALKARLNQLESQLAEQRTADTKRPANATTKPSLSIGDTQFQVGGYIKVDAMMSRYSAGEVAGTSPARDFHVPSATPVGNGASSQVFDAHAQQTRVFLKTTTATESGKNINGYIEIDFLSPARGNERVTNNYDPGLRHAYLSYGNWLVGQTWTTFQDLGALPETVDFVGASDGTTFGRQPQVRYSKGNFQVALENPESFIKPETGASVDTDDNSLPDLVARYTHKADFGHVSVAALGRQIKTKNSGATSDTVMGGGVSFSGKVKVGTRDDIRFMLTHGSGIGRYVGLGTITDANMVNGKLKANDVSAGYLTYRHFWTDKLRSSLQVSGLMADNKGVMLADAITTTKKNVSGLTNLIYSVTPKLEIGAEYLHSKRSVESSDDGTLDRLQVMAKYSF
ncbi:MAG: DcaP family trimeric outer membrane transporter [Moraxellaceae bacterium]|nr:DcaP family trimeric outer membrane transporter [Moraxellaceae bacterium]